MTKAELKEELKQSMLAKDSEKTSVLRMLLAAIQSYEMKKSEEEYDKKVKEAEKTNTDINEQSIRYEVSEEDLEVVLQKEVKQRRDSIEQFKLGGRDDLVAKESNELEILSAFLPQQMSEEEIRVVVKETLNETGATTLADIGKVMGALMPKVKGKADGSLVGKIVRESLS